MIQVNEQNLYPDQLLLYVSTDLDWSDEKLRTMMINEESINKLYKSNFQISINDEIDEAHCKVARFSETNQQAFAFLIDSIWEKLNKVATSKDDLINEFYALLFNDLIELRRL
jgi:hypothetical protein